MVLDEGPAEQPIAPRSIESGIRTRGVILRVAERLFAAKGFDGVSMREIGIEAGVPLALVSYHFKSKLGLYRAVFRAHEAITKARIEQLEKFRPSEDSEKTVRDLVLILVQPVIEMAAAPGGRDFARLIAREVEAERGVLAEFIDPVAKLIIGHLERAFPELDKTTVHWAFLFASGALAINHAATGRIERLSDGRCHSDDPAEIIDHLVDFIAGGILAAFSQDTARKRRSKNSRNRASSPAGA
jgi:AcrR family transcriptional regulator